MADFVKVQFDKLLLVFLVLFLAVYALHTAHHSADVKLAEWATKTSDLCTGALLTLITGGRLMQRRVDTENGTSPVNGAKKSVTTTTMSTDQVVQQPASRAADLKPDAPVSVEVINKPDQPVPVTPAKPERKDDAPKD